MKKKSTLNFLLGLTLFFSSTSLVHAININTIADLKKVGNDPAYPLTGSYVLINDLDFSSEPVNGNGANFTSIGTQSDSFTGTFDGNGKTISNLKIVDTNQYYIGLFKFIASGEVKNLTIANSSITGDDYVGAIAGGIYKSVVNNCHNVNTTVTGDSYVGGISGTNSAGVVRNSSNSGTIKGLSGMAGHVGGICGDIELYESVSGVIIENSFNTGSVTSESTSVGGIVGQIADKTSVSNCYNTGKIDGTQWSGGIIGRNEGALTNSYNVGVVTSYFKENGAICGLIYENGSIKNCYYDNKILTTNLTGAIGTDSKPKGVDDAGNNVIGLTTSQMNQSSSYSSWTGFSTYWKLCPSRNYPYLVWENYDCINTGIKQQSANQYDVRINNNILSCDTQVILMQVYGLSGAKLAETTSAELNVSNLPNGIYIIKIKDSNNQVESTKIQIIR